MLVTRRPPAVRDAPASRAGFPQDDATASVEAVAGAILLGAVADDFTGATDLAGVLVRDGLRAIVTIGVQRDVELPDVDAVVVALKSRTAPVADAVADSRAALEWLRELGARNVYFKICSTFDSTPQGNIGPVADALLDDLGAVFAVVTPAYPANGRTVVNGHLFVGGIPLSESSMARHPLTPMRDSNLVRVLQQQTERRVGLLGEEGLTYAIADATDDADLLDLGARFHDLPLLVGGSGLAHGLAHSFGRTGSAAAAHPEGPAIVLAGSLSDATREQITRMSEHYPAVHVDDYDGYRGETLLVHSGARAGADAAAIEAQLAAAARDAVASGARRVIVAGGETSGAVVQALGIRALAVGREITPGVPWMTSIDDPPLALALKSGNFGGPDFFLEALAA
jgi:3-dehydrotetronate 4-kinase